MFTLVKTSLPILFSLGMKFIESHRFVLFLVYEHFSI